jgi:hypothetical protein
MAFINSHKQPVVNTELDLFTVPPTQESVENGQFVSFRPISSITINAPIEFNVPGSGSEYIDVSQTMIYLKVRLQKEHAENQLPAECGPVNNFIHSLFSQVDVFLNGKCVTPPSNNYHYRSYISNLLNYGSDATKSHLTTSLWNRDTPDNFNANNLNGGYRWRRDMTRDNKSFDMIAPLHIDLKSSTKYLINGVDMAIKLTQSRPQFAIMSIVADPRCEIIIEDAELFVRKVKISPSVLLGHARALSLGTAKYPITRVEVKTVTVPAGVHNKTLDSLFTGQMPTRCIVALVNNNAFNGSYPTNPFKFEHYNLSYFSFYMDGQQIPSKPFTPNFEDNLYIRAYNSLFDGSGIFHKDVGMDISRDDFAKGYCLICTDMTPDLSCHEGHWCLIKNGNLRLELRFKEALEETITVVCFAEFSNLIEIDAHRNVILDYAS